MDFWENFDFNRLKKKMRFSIPLYFLCVYGMRCFKRLLTDLNVFFNEWKDHFTMSHNIYFTFRYWYLVLKKPAVTNYFLAMSTVLERTIT